MTADVKNKHYLPINKCQHLIYKIKFSVNEFFFSIAIVMDV